MYGVRAYDSYISSKGRAMNARKKSPVWVLTVPVVGVGIAALGAQWVIDWLDALWSWVRNGLFRDCE